MQRTTPSNKTALEDEFHKGLFLLNFFILGPAEHIV